MQCECCGSENQFAKQPVISPNMAGQMLTGAASSSVPLDSVGLKTDQSEKEYGLLAADSLMPKYLQGILTHKVKAEVTGNYLILYIPDTIVNLTGPLMCCWKIFLSHPFHL